MGPRNHVLDGDPDLEAKGQFEGSVTWGTIVVVSCATTAEHLHSSNTPMESF